MVQQVDADEVLKLVVSMVEQRDILRWPHTTDGRPTVRSLYAYLGSSRSTGNMGIGHQPANQSPMWQAIWKSKVWPKIQTYTWKLATNSIACV